MMGLVRDNFAMCAVGRGNLQANFTLQGHRQVVNTSCPGDALYNEIKGWEHFGVCICELVRQQGSKFED